MAGEKIQTIYCWEFKTDRLNISMASSEKGAIKVSLNLDMTNTNIIEYFQHIFSGIKIKRDKNANLPLINAIKTSLTGGSHTDNLPLDIKGTSFQIIVWRMITRIPFGQTMTYGEIAKRLGQPKGARAVGMAMRKNPLPLIFPCHRVLASKGLGGFNEGIDIKKYLLNRESTMKDIKKDNF